MGLKFQYLTTMLEIFLNSLNFLVINVMENYMKLTKLFKKLISNLLKND